MFRMLMKAIVTAIVVPPLVCVPIVGWILIFLWLHIFGVTEKKGSDGYVKEGYAC